MEADWEVEVGGDAPVIEAYWPGVIDLGEQPGRAGEIAETKELTGLAEALVRLNASALGYWTAKCDVFEPESIDAEELGASGPEAEFTQAAYIDVLMFGRKCRCFDSEVERVCRLTCAGLRAVPLRLCRVDIVVRRALLQGEFGVGATVYFTACGRSRDEGKARLGACIERFVEWLTQPDRVSG